MARLSPSLLARTFSHGSVRWFINGVGPSSGNHSGKMKMTRDQIWSFLRDNRENLPPWGQNLCGKELGGIAAPEIVNIEEKIVDGNYMDFLKTQIALEARGPEWTRVLEKRLSVLEPYVGRSVITVLMADIGNHLMIRIDPTQPLIIDVEQ